MRRNNFTKEEEEEEEENELRCNYMEIIQHHLFNSKQSSSVVSIMRLAVKHSSAKIKTRKIFRRWSINRRLSQYVKKSTAVATLRKLSREIKMEAWKFA